MGSVNDSALVIAHEPLNVGDRLAALSFERDRKEPSDRAPPHQALKPAQWPTFAARRVVFARAIMTRLREPESRRAAKNGARTLELRSVASSVRGAESTRRRRVQRVPRARGERARGATARCAIHPPRAVADEATSGGRRLICMRPAIRRIARIKPAHGGAPNLAAIR